MRTLTLVFSLPLLSCLGLASNANCPSTSSGLGFSLNSGAYNFNEHPPGCTQINMQFDFGSGSVVALGSASNNADNTTFPSDSSVSAAGSGVALGTGANSQLLEFTMLPSNFSANNSPGGVAQQHWDYTITFSVTDLNSATGIIGAFFAIKNLSPYGGFAATETFCPGVTTFSSGCANKTVVSYTGPTSYNVGTFFGHSAAVQIEFNEVLNDGDGFSFDTFDVGFDEGTPEPASIFLFGSGFALVMWLYRRKQIDSGSSRAPRSGTDSF